MIGQTCKRGRLWWAVLLLLTPGVAPAQVQVATLGGLHGPVRRLAFSPDGKTLAALATDTRGREPAKVHLWDVAGKKHLAELRCRWGSPGHTLAFSPDGRTLVSTCPGPKRGARGYVVGHAEVWDTRSRKVVRRFDLAEGMGCDGLVLPDNKTLVVGGPDVGLYDLTTGKETGRLEALHNGMFVAVSRDGRWLAGGDPKAGKVSLWDLTRRKRLWTVDVHPGMLRPDRLALAFSPDGQFLACASDALSCEVVIWGRAKGDRRDRLDLGRRITCVFGLAWTTDGNALAVGGSAPVGFWLWEPNAKRVCPTTRFAPGIWYNADHIAISPDGKTLAVGSQDVRLWDISSAKRGR
jgi:WD40 repeat protein